MKKNTIILIILTVALLTIGILYLPRIKKSFVVTPEEIAKEWILNNSPTYTFDGSDLEFIESKDYSISFNFNSTYRGYGDRSKEDLVEDLVVHKIVVLVLNGEVINAITDNIFSETDNRLIKVGSDKEDLINFSIFFRKLGGGKDLFPVARNISKSQISTTLFESLIEGPNPNEKANGFYSAINPKTKLLSVKLEERILYLNFSGELTEELSDDNDRAFAKEQIIKTGKQITTASKIVILIDGIEGIL